MVICKVDSKLCICQSLILHPHNGYYCVLCVHGKYNFGATYLRTLAVLPQETRERAPPPNPQNPTKKKKLSLFFLYVKWFGFGEGKGDKGDEGKGDKGEALLTTGSMI